MTSDRFPKRTREITVRVNDKELAQLKERQQGTTMARWLRDLGLGVSLSLIHI